MKITTALFLLAFPFSSFGLGHSTPVNLYDHLVEVNENWNTQDYSLFNIDEPISFQSDVDRIQTHLLFVEKNLRTRSTTKLSSLQKANRLRMLDVLHQYAHEKVFPVNSNHAVRQPYFIDKYGTHCAVGFLVKESGFGWISKNISATQNYAYVREIESVDLVQWSLDYGFTLEELAWIQPTYMPDQSYSQLGNGANGKVTKSVGYYLSWYFSGEFDTLNNLPCLQVGVYEDGQLSCLGSGIDGEINDIDYHSTNGVTVTGHFLHNGTYYPMASFQNDVWIYHDIPNRPNARATAFGSQNTYRTYVAIDSPTQPGTQEIWSLSNSGWWSHMTNVFGTVHEISSLGTYVGVFDSSEVWVNGISTILHSKNILLRNYMEEWETVSGVVPDTIFTITKKQNVIYVGGTASENVGSSGALVSSILNNIAQPIMTVASLGSSSKYYVHHLDLIYNDVYASGDFQFTSGLIGNFGRNIAKLYPASGTFGAFGYFDSTVYTFNKVNTDFYVAGAFNLNFTSTSTQPLNRLAKLDGFLSIPENEDALFKDVFIAPNPSKGNLNISGILPAELESIQIIDMQGKVCLSSKLLSIDGDELQPGMYLVKLNAVNGQTIQKRWVKE